MCICACRKCVCVYSARLFAFVPFYCVRECSCVGVFVARVFKCCCVFVQRFCVLV